MTENSGVVDFNELFKTSFAKVMASGEIEAHFEKTIKETITSQMDRAIRWDNEFEKQIKEVFKEILHFDPRQMKLDDYRDLVMTTVRAHIQDHFNAELVERIKNDLDRITSSAPERTAISEMREEFEKHVREENDDGCGCHDPEEEEVDYTFIFEKSKYGSMYLYMDEKPDKSKYDCKYRLFLTNVDKEERTEGQKNELRIFNVSVDGNEIGDKSFRNKIPSFFGYGSDLYAMYLRKSVIVADETPQDTDRY